MLKFVKAVTGVEYTALHPLFDDEIIFRVYAEPYQKYKEWDFFIVVLFPYYRTKVARERLWTNRNTVLPYTSQIFTEYQLKERYHLIPYGVKGLARMAEIKVTLSDGTTHRYWFETDKEAEEQVAGLIKEWGLKQYYDISQFPFPENKVDIKVKL